MIRKKSLKRIQEQIAKLQAEAKQLAEAQKDKPGLAQVTKLIRKYKLTAADLKEAFGKPGRKRKGKVKGSKVAVKYRSGENTWSGRGLAPKWLKEAEQAGKSREEFLVQ
jgi:DNA-binding protein H-NS